MAVDLTTGQRKWHYQVIHHEIWDLDNSSAPLLMDVLTAPSPDAGAAEPGESAEDVARTCHAHPTLPEAVKEAALAVAGRALHI